MIIILGRSISNSLSRYHTVKWNLVVSDIRFHLSVLYPTSNTKKKAIKLLTSNSNSKH